MASRATQRVRDNSPLASQSLSFEGRILEVNCQWERLAGYSAAEVVGRQYAELVPEDHLEDFRKTLGTLVRTGELDGVDCFLRRKDGCVRNIRVFAQADVAAGHIECLLVDITHFRQTERDLMDSEEHFRSLFEMLPTPTLLHDGKRVMMANPACARFLGYDDPAELEGVRVVTLVHPEDRPQVAQRVRRMMEGDWTAPAATERFVRKDGSTVAGETVASSLTLGGKRVIHVIALDLSERIEAEQALAESERRFRTLFEFSSDPIVVHDDRNVQFANRAALAAFGFPDGARIAGKALADFVHPDSVKLVQRRAASVLKKDFERKPVELHLLRADGSDWYAEVYSVSLPLEGGVMVQTIFRDLTERKRAEAELETYRQQLEHLLEERTASLEQAKQQLSAVTAVVSRTVEMRDPYTAGHQRRVAALAVAIAHKMGMSDADIANLEVAAALHDVGKVSVPAEILSRPSKLTALEFELVKAHVEAGYEIVRSAALPETVAEMVYEHHERLDGSGYPRGLTAEELLPGSRVLMVADVVEAMCTHRPYRPAFGLAAALEEITAGSGTRYDQDVVEACHAVVEDGFGFIDEF